MCVARKDFEIAELVPQVRTAPCSVKPETISIVTSSSYPVIYRPSPETRGGGLARRSLLGGGLGESGLLGAGDAAARFGDLGAKAKGAVELGVLAAGVSIAVLEEVIGVSPTGMALGAEAAVNMACGLTSESAKLGCSKVARR